MGDFSKIQNTDTADKIEVSDDEDKNDESFFQELDLKRDFSDLVRNQ